MRIVGGKYRGKKLITPSGKDVRPTSERAREAIFNILYSMTGGNYSDYNLADIFCGTGAFGFEALSRGFTSVCFVDINTKTVARNAELFATEKTKIKIKQYDATKLPHILQPYQMIFCDAPYAKGLTDAVLKELVQKNWLSSGGMCILEVRKDETIVLPKDLEIIDERVYGLAKVIFLRKN